MNKIIIGIVVGAALAVSGVAFASTTMSLVNNLVVGQGYVYKITDKTISCYVFDSGKAGGISCIDTSIK